MTPLLLAACAALGFGSPHSAALSPAVLPLVAMRVDLPFKAPAGWKVEPRERGTVLTPRDVSEGTFYAVTITPVEGKAGSLDAILDAAKKAVSDIGPFTAAIDPRQAASDGGWDYKFVLGTIATTDRSLLAQVMAVKKGDEGGMIVVLSESVETMTKYADALAEMVRGMGASPPAPAPGSAGAVDLVYTVPPGWTETKINGFPSLVKEKNEVWVKYRVSLLIFPTEPLNGSVREQFEGYWKAFVTPNYTTTIVPMPLVARLLSGHACAFDADGGAKDKGGTPVTVAVYMLAHGGRVVPVLGIYAGTDWSADSAVELETGRFLDSARIPGGSTERVALFDPAKVVGEWSESSSEWASYVTRSGQYAGDASITTGAYFTLGADGSYSRTLTASRSGRSVREKDAGTWLIDDDELVLSAGGRYSLLGYGADPKVGRFLVLGNYSNTKARLKFTNPRGILQAMWLKAK